MALHLNRWSPDTCEGTPCELEYSFDDSLPADQVGNSVQFVRAIRKCSAHASLSDADTWTHAGGDNKRRNGIKADLKAQFPTLFISAAEADADNKAKLLATMSNLPNRIKTHINGLSGDSIKKMLQAQNITPTQADELWPGLEISYSFSGSGASRVITVTMPALSAAEKTALNTYLQSKYNGRVVVV